MKKAHNINSNERNANENVYWKKSKSKNLFSRYFYVDKQNTLSRYRTHKQQTRTHMDTTNTCVPLTIRWIKFTSRHFKFSAFLLLVCRTKLCAVTMQMQREEKKYGKTVLLHGIHVMYSFIRFGRSVLEVLHLIIMYLNTSFSLRSYSNQLRKYCLMLWNFSQKEVILPSL